MNRLVLVFVFALTFSALSLVQAQSWDDQMDSGETAYFAGNYYEARGFYLEALKTANKNPDKSDHRIGLAFLGVANTYFYELGNVTLSQENDNQVTGLACDSYLSAILILRKYLKTPAGSEDSETWVHNVDAEKDYFTCLLRRYNQVTGNERAKVYEYLQMIYSLGVVNNQIQQKEYAEIIAKQNAK